MKICIPTMGNNGLDDIVGEHFGRVPYYTIVGNDIYDVKVVPNTSHHMGGKGDPPEIMLKENVNVLLCQGLGKRAINMFEGFGIEVYIGASGTVRGAISAFKKGLLKKASESDGCQNHAFKDHHHN